VKRAIVLPHQSYYMQAPSLFHKVKWFFLCCGYGAGKTRANVLHVLYDVKRLQGKKDRAGDYVRLMVCGITLSHLEKTFLIYFRQYLDDSKTPYIENKKFNYFTIGTVTVLLQPLENPGEIFGLDVHKIYVEEADELTTDKMLEATKALNERCRQVIPGERGPCTCLGGNAKIICRKVDVKRIYGLTDPFLCRIVDISVGDFVLTRRGWRRIIGKYNTGYREIVRVHGVPLTPDHTVWNESIKDWQEVGTIKNNEHLLSISLRRVKQWQKIQNCLKKTNEALLLLMGLDTIGNTTLKSLKDITGLLRLRVKDLRHCMWLYGKAFTGRFQQEWLYTIKILTQLITLLKTWTALQSTNTTYITEEINRAFTIDLVLIVEKWLSQTEKTRLGVIDARQSDVKTSVKNATKSEVKEPIQVFGTKSRLGRFVSIVGLFLRQARSSVLGVKLVEGFVGTGRLKKPLVKKAEKEVRDTTNVSALFVKQNIYQNCRLTSALRDAVIRLEQLINLGLEESFLRIERASFVEKLLGHVKEGMQKLVPLHALRKLESVYDITVEDEHEFFTNKFLVHNCFASTSQGQKGLYAVYCHFKKTGIAFVLIRGWTEHNPFLPKSLIEDMYKMYTPEEREVFMHGEFLSIAKGRVIPGFDWARNYVGYDLDIKLRPDEVVYWAQDVNTGYNRGSAYVVRGGVIYCIKHYDFPSLDDAASVVRHDFPEQEIKWLPDVTIKDTFPSMAQELRRYNIKIIYKKKSPLVEDSCFLVSKLCYLSRFIVCKIAKDVAEALNLAMRDKDNKIPKGVGKSSPIHTLDGARYAAVHIVATHPDFADIRKLIADKRASLRDDAAKTPSVKRLDGGYVEIDPGAFIKRAP